MPEGFAFPVDHRFWTPLKLLPSDDAPRQALPITIFGRPAPAATLESAQAELTAIGRRTSDAFPETYAQFRPRISTYAALWADEDELWQVDLIRFLLTLVVVVVSVNVAALIYARTATRQGEIALRAAIGASRRRIVVQLFIEALVLSAGAAAVELGIARLVLSQVDLVRPPKGSGQMPYWDRLEVFPRRPSSSSRASQFSAPSLQESYPHCRLPDAACSPGSGNCVATPEYIWAGPGPS